MQTSARRTSVRRPRRRTLASGGFIAFAPSPVEAEPEDERERGERIPLQHVGSILIGPEVGCRPLAHQPVRGGDRIGLFDDDRQQIQTGRGGNARQIEVLPQGTGSSLGGELEVALGREIDASDHRQRARWRRRDGKLRATLTLRYPTAIDEYEALAAGELERRDDVIARTAGMDLVVDEEL